MENKECEYQNICINFNDNLYSKCPVFGWGNKCCYAILYKQLIQLKAENEQLTQKLEKAKQALSELVNMFFSDLEDFEIVERLNEYYLKQLKEAKQSLKELNT